MPQRPLGFNVSGPSLCESISSDCAFRQLWERTHSENVYISIKSHFWPHSLVLRNNGCIFDACLTLNAGPSSEAIPMRRAGHVSAT